MLVTLPEFSEIPYISHGFTLRKLDNGQIFDFSLNIDKQINSAEKNLGILGKYIGFPSAPVVNCRQEHGNNVIQVDLHKNSPGEIRCMKADALITNQPNVLIAILTADCLPILIIDKKQKAVGAVHAGRNGTSLFVSKSAIEHMMTHYNSDPENLIVGIGPGINKCCYEVDLLDDNINQFIEKGVLRENIYNTGLCTSCRKDDFFSYRAEKGKTGRMLSFVMIKNYS